MVPAGVGRDKPRYNPYWES